MTRGSAALEPLSTIGSTKAGQSAAPARRGTTTSTPSVPIADRHLRIRWLLCFEVVAPYGVEMSRFTWFCDRTETDRARSSVRDRVFNSRVQLQHCCRAGANAAIG